jgi:hypothetical protein
MCVCVRACVCYILAHLPCEDEVGSGTSESGSASNAGSVTHTQRQAFTHFRPLLLLLFLTNLLLCFSPLFQDHRHYHFIQRGRGRQYHYILERFGNQDYQEVTAKVVS